MLRKIIEIDEEKCNGCGICITACHEGALKMVNGKAKLVADNICDGLGDCLPECPTGAISIIEREAAPFDVAAVEAAKKAAGGAVEPIACGCPGTMAKAIERKPVAAVAAPLAGEAIEPQLGNWPVQLKLVSVTAPYLRGAAILIAADCTAFAYPDIHRKFMSGKVTLIGCPKLDEGDYSEKLAAIFSTNEPRSITVLRMEVPCCSGITNAVKKGLEMSGKVIPWRVITVTTDGQLIEE
ncbi:MAG: 4Fe-4S binding protein [Lentisphaerae bacterium]|nr:4Fe-4S binding protein [Lentisphaerota bacterium]